MRQKKISLQRAVLGTFNLILHQSDSGFEVANRLNKYFRKFHLERPFQEVRLAVERLVRRLWSKPR